MWQRLKAFFQVLTGTSAGNVALLPLHGPIFAGRKLRHGLNLENTEKLILRAFSVPNLKAVALSINSPGGSPVQSALILQRIRDLADKHNIPVLAFAEDIAASGGYMLALAADEIVAHPASLVGSIGVVYSGFGFSGAMKKIGIERRLHTAGENKAFMDPFSPERPGDVARLKKLQSGLYDYFKNLV
ncbi:MAG TPA: S49 family peptidase, partial [Sphingomonadales bacterium]|nr:S49 family peptidase [Sphingomonadales bacterium]